VGKSLFWLLPHFQELTYLVQDMKLICLLCLSSPAGYFLKRGFSSKPIADIEPFEDIRILNQDTVSGDRVSLGSETGKVR
jgi:hypothetical protein